MEKSPAGKPSRKSVMRTVLLLVNSILFFTVYRVLLFFAERTDNTWPSFVVMVLYLALLLGFTLAYLIYNRFLYRKGLTPDQLSPAWSEEQKAEFLADGERRLEKSRWMMLIIFPLVLTFFIDAFDLFILDMLR